MSYLDDCEISSSNYQYLIYDFEVDIFHYMHFAFECKAARKIGKKFVVFSIKRHKKFLPTIYLKISNHLINDIVELIEKEIDDKITNYDELFDRVNPLIENIIYERGL